MSERELLLRQIQSVQFSLWELHIFLDTHPNHEEATKMMRECQEKSDKLTQKYEEQFGPLNSASAGSNMWGWVSTPWPWENTTEKGEGCLNVDV